MHGLAQNVLAQRGPERAATVSSARKGSPPRSFELDIFQLCVAVVEITQQNGAAIPELWIQVAKLMPGIRHRQWVGIVWHQIAGKYLSEFFITGIAEFDI